VALAGGAWDGGGFLFVLPVKLSTASKNQLGNYAGEIVDAVEFNCLWDRLGTTGES
jgi:hypothetical protein